MLIKIGIDFDNTIVNYEDSFHEEAVKRKIFTKNQRKKNSKEILKNKLISKNKEEEWTTIQGIVYGKKMLRAKPYKNSINFINKFCDKKNFELFIVSHKTLYPIIGEKINLHKISKNWIKKKKIFKNKKIGWIKKHVFFLKTKEEKIKKIVQLKCDYFIDDLEEILKKLPKKIKKIHFDPYKKSKKPSLKSWGSLIEVMKNNDK
tara:strand:- start:21 stop:632 length:612 start_codon:yes stop_codon:yes gene_type:complete